MTELEKIHDKLDALERRLFIDNGTESIQSRLNRHERWIRAMAWLTATAAGASVVTLVSVGIKILLSAAW
ncbi:MAG: hypothetical protein JSW27_06480 [Phycisphaerales bacterium]|nr:MAG: hypothetical protein JSW27_06480 [Phycisphaerales bacterium]